MFCLLVIFSQPHFSFVSASQVREATWVMRTKIGYTHYFVKRDIITLTSTEFEIVTALVLV